MASVVIESKESLTGIPTATPSDTNQVVESSGDAPVSSVDTMSGSQGDQHTTMSASMVIEGTPPSAMQGMNRYNLPPVPANYSVSEYRERVQHVNRVRIEEAEDEMNSLCTELSRSQLLNMQLQQLLEEDQESHPSNKIVTAIQAQLITVKGELETLQRSHAIKVNELER